jgi:hypothetical protein
VTPQTNITKKAALEPTSLAQMTQEQMSFMSGADVIGQMPI